LPHLIDFYEDHKADRDKFEILAFHDSQAANFAELDSKLEPIIKNAWSGRPLPFPILLDSTGETIEKFGISAFPTTLLIDPEGRLVGRAKEADLEKHLPPVPLAERLPKVLDRKLTVSISDATLKEACDIVSKAAKVPVALDPAALESAGLTPESKVPLKIAGLISTRSVFHLLLDAFGLDMALTPEGLTIISGRAGWSRSRPPSRPQETSARRIGETLKTKASFRFDKAPLEEVAQYFEGQTTEKFVLDPAGLRSGAIDPKAAVSGSTEDQPLGAAIERMLRPLGLHLEVRDEVVVIAKAP
jgi:hypothetical protein